MDRYTEDFYKTIISEIRNEHSLHPNTKDSTITQSLKEGIFDINEEVGKYVDYDKDLRSRSLLKFFVLYKSYQRIAEFKELYLSEYTALQIKYNRDSNI